jgi:hypothetical protein
MEEESHKDEKDKKVKEEAKEKDGEKLEEEVDELEEGQEELEEGGGQMPFDESSRRSDERGPADRLEEKKAFVGKAKTMKGAPKSQSFTPAKAASKNGSKGEALREEEMPEDDMADVEGGDEMDAAPAADAGGLDVEGLVKELIRVITDKVPGAADVISVEEEGDETEVEMGGEEEGGEGEMGGEEELDEAALEKVVAETVKRVKGRLMESKRATSTTVSKQELAKKVAAKVAERLKKA